VDTPTTETQEKVHTGDVLGKYETEEAYKEAYNGMLKEIEEWAATIETATDWKSLRNVQSELRAKIKILFLKKEENDSLNAKIDEAAELINKKQNEERDQKEQLFKENQEKYAPQVEKACKDAAAAETFSEARDMLIKLQGDLRNIQFKRSHRDEFMEKIQTTFTALNEKRALEQENYEMECIDNYHNLKKVIDEACDFSKNTERFADGRNKLIEVQQQIRGKKLKREQRDELYQIIREHFDMLNERQAAERMVGDEEAAVNYDKIKKIVDEAIDFAKETEDYGEARTRLIAAQKEIKAIRLKREQRDELFAAIREIFTAINDQQAEERSSFEEEANKNFTQLTDKVDEAFELVHGITDFRLIREALMNVQAEVKLMKLRREQRNELFARIREAFGIFDKKRNDFFSKRREERVRKLTVNLDSMKMKVERIEELMKKDQETLEGLKAENAEESQTQAVEKKIETKQSQLEEAKGKLAEIEKEIDEVNNPKEKKEEEKVA
jgi:hypothetical protein